MHKEEKEMAWYCVVLIELGALQRERKTILLCSGLPLSCLRGAVLAIPSPVTKEVNYNRACMIGIISPKTVGTSYIVIIVYPNIVILVYTSWVNAVLRHPLPYLDILCRT